MEKDTHTWTLSDTTQASNSGRLSVKWYRWLAHYPKWPLVWAIGFGLLSALAWAVHWSFWIPAALFLAMNIFYWQRVSEHFKYGDVNPGIVVSVDPMAIAVSTDLTKGVGNYPVIKIIRKELRTIMGQVPRIGVKLPTVSLYEGCVHDDLPHWIDFHPCPAECATNDINEIKRLMSTFTERDWSKLEAGVERIPRPYLSGLYHARVRPTSVNHGNSSG